MLTPLEMKHRHNVKPATQSKASRLGTLGLSLLNFALIACEQPPAVPIVEVDEEPTLEEELAEAVRSPNWSLVMGQDYRVLEAPTREETRAVLFQPRDVLNPGSASVEATSVEQPGPLLQALLDAGMAEERAIETVYAASAHNSGQPHDPVRQRAEAWRAAYQSAVSDFESELNAAAEEQGLEVDRETLFEQGIILGWGGVQ